MFTENLLMGEQHLAIGNIEPGYIYRLDYKEEISFYVRLVDRATTTIDGLVIKPTEDVNSKTYSIVDPYLQTQYFVMVPEAGGYVPVVNLDTGKIMVVEANEYNNTLNELREKSKYATIIAELNHEEMFRYAKRTGQILAIDIPRKYLIDGGVALAFRPIYKEASNVKVTYPAEKPKEEISKGYTLHTNPVELDLEWYYYNWFTISKEEQQDVLDWVSTNNWGFKLANKINQRIESKG